MNPTAKTALLVIDVQKELFEKSIPIYQAPQLLEKLNRLIDQAHQAQVPVFFIQHSSEKILLQGTVGWQFHPDLQLSATDHIVQKHHGNAFEKTDLQAELEALGIQQLIITGLVTHGCVKATSLGALELGYQVRLVEDGHSNYHKNAPAVIAEWNEKLKLEGATLVKAAEISFAN
jgi:nicotinamidase-related amidase